MNLPVPPYWVRRVVLIPAVFALMTVVLFGIPLALAALLVLSFLIPGKWRPLRLAGFTLVYMAMEWLGLIAAFGLWLISGFGLYLKRPWFQQRHYGLLRTMLASLVWVAERMFRLSIVTEGDEPEAAAVIADRPALVLSRHAGPGDSFLIVDRLLRVRRRRPRIVLKATLQLDPFIDVVLNRLPCRFIDAAPGAGAKTVEAIADLATDMHGSDALVIFPEGGNFTPGRRVRAIERLRSAGREDAAERAERLRHTLPPRPAGVFAARGSAPDAGVAVVAHTGLDRMNTLRDVWRELPQEKTPLVTWRWFAADDVPEDLPGLSDWLNAVWSGVDGWIESHQPPTAA
jgi:1-acyl-sn-glycerol-3-phosphate acyltransferase